MTEKVGMVNNIDSLIGNNKHLIQRVGPYDSKTGFKEVLNADECNKYAQKHHKSISDKNKCSTHFIYNNDNKTCFNVIAPHNKDFKKNISSYNKDSLNSFVLHFNSHCYHDNKTKAKIEVLKNKMIANRGTILKNEKSMMQLAHEIAQLEDPSLTKPELEKRAHKIASKILDERQFNQQKELKRKLKQQATEIDKNNKTLFNIKNEMSTFETIANALNLNIKDESTKLKNELNIKNKQVDIVRNISNMNETMESLLINSLYGIIIIGVILTIYLVSKYYL